MDNCIIGVDLGGTQMRAARFDTDLNLLERVAHPTKAHQGRDAVIQRLLDTIAEVIPADPDAVLGIGVSAPGPTNPRTGVVVSPPNLKGWDNVPLLKIIQERFGFPTYIGNDANVAALAETTRGAGTGFSHVIYLTVSTGIGSGVIDDGRLIIGAKGLGAEAGHMILLTGDRVSSLEREAAGPAIARKAVARLEIGEPSAMRDMVAGDLTRITGKIVGEAATAGDPLAVDLIQEAGRLVGLGLVTLLHLFNPEIIIIGGGVSLTGELLFEPMRETVRQYALNPAYWDHVPIVPAALGDNVALIGAAALVTTRGGTYLKAQ